MHNYYQVVVSKKLRLQINMNTIFIRALLSLIMFSYGLKVTTFFDWHVKIPKIIAQEFCWISETKDANSFRTIFCIWFT